MTAVMRSENSIPIMGRQNPSQQKLRVLVPCGRNASRGVPKLIGDQVDHVVLRLHFARYAHQQGHAREH